MLFVIALDFSSSYLNDAETDKDVTMSFNVDEVTALLLQTRFRTPTPQLTLADKLNITSALNDYHCMLKSKLQLTSM